MAKDKIKQLAEVMGWIDLEWTDEGSVLGRASKNSDKLEEFPPSRRDGNGVVWLMTQLACMGITADISTKSVRWDGRLDFIAHVRSLNHKQTKRSTNCCDALVHAALHVLLDVRKALR